MGSNKEHANASPGLVLVFNDFPMRVLTFDVVPESSYFSDQIRMAGDNVMKRDYSTWSYEGGVHFEIHSNAFVRVVSIDEKEVQLISVEDRGDFFGRAGGVGILSQ